MPHTMPTWLERLLGASASAGEGTAWSIDAAWPWPPWATLLFLAAAAGLIVSLYLRDSGRASRAYRLSLAVVRLSLVALAMLMIARTTLVLKRTVLPEAVVIIDDSLSMGIVDRSDRVEGSDESSRWQRMESLLTRGGGEFLRGIADRRRLSVYFLTGERPIRGEDATEIAAEISGGSPVGKSTRLGEAVLNAIDRQRGSAPAAIVLLTDGINTEGPGLAEAAQRARLRDAPLWFVGLGGEQPPRDLILSDLLGDDLIFIDDVVNFECGLRAVGFSGRKAKIVLREKDKPAPLAEIEIAIPADDHTAVARLSHRPDRVGRFDYVVEVEPLEGEMQTANNRRSHSVEVREEKIRVLLVWARPDYEFRYLRNLLQRDEAVVPHTILQDADPEYAGQDAAALSAFPAQADDLFAYDVVILGDADPALLGPEALRNLAEFVERPAAGGSLILVAGPNFMPSAYRGTPLERLMPFDVRNFRSPAPDQIIAEGFAARPTELGLAGPGVQLGDDAGETRRIWSALPRLYWLLEAPKPNPAARVLLDAPDRTAPDGRPLPVALFQYAGAGKVLFLASGETWRWRFREGEKYYDRFWMQTIRWLARSLLAETGGPAVLTADRREYEQSEPVRLQVRFADARLAPADDDGVVAALETPDGKTERLALRRAAAERGLFQAVVNPLQAGDYRAWIVAPELGASPPAVEFRVSPPAGEFAETRMDADAMRRAAEISGGRYFTIETAGDLAEQLPRGRPTPVESLPPRPLWNSWPVLALFLGLLAAEWILRKRRGMV